MTLITVEDYVHAKSRQRYLLSSFKRYIDVIGATVGILVLWPLLMIVVPLIRLIDHVSPIFHQERVGLNGKPFILHKLRTLTIIETSDMMDPSKVERKPFYEATKTGKLWRVTSIDELPQFWNVLKGEMSLVGHRPFPYYYLDNLYKLPNTDAEAITNYLNIISLYKPGVTSLSSIRGRSNLSMQEKMLCDIEYAKKANFAYDIFILLVSVKVVITREGAR